MVRKKGLEPSRPCGHKLLRLARLPIPPLPHGSELLIIRGACHLVQTMFHTFEIDLTWSELVKKTIKEINADNVFGLAAQLGYYFLLALVPAIVSVAALASFLPGDVLHRAVQSIAAFVPGDLVRIIQEQLANVGGSADGGVFTFGFLMAVWSSSAAMVSICDSMNRAYDIEEGRPWWKVRFTAITLTLGVALFVLVSITLVLAGPRIADILAANIGLGPMFSLSWKILQWPLVFALITVAIGLVYYFAPDAEQDWEWITPGAVLATILWLISSLIFKIYISNFANYNETYGSLGGIVVLMLWFYISGLAILAGAEMNAEIEHASPHGKAPGEKVMPGQKKKIGAAAARAYEERKRQNLNLR